MAEAPSGSNSNGSFNPRQSNQQQQQHQNQQQQQQQHQQSQTIRQHQQQTQQSNQILSAGIINGPRTIVLNRQNNAFGFTLRHFIVYPPDSCTDPNVVNQLQAAGVLNFAQPMDTVFVKKVTPESEAQYAGLHEGDRLLAVNGIPVAGKQFADIVGTIQKIPKTLTLQIVPKCYDILQTFFSDTAYNPETNQRPQQQVTTLSQQQQQSQQSQMLKSPQMPVVPPTRRHPQTQQNALQNFTDKQESLYSTLQELAVGNANPNINNNNNLYAEPQRNHQKLIQQRLQQQYPRQMSPQQQQQQQQQIMPMYKQKENIPQINLINPEMSSSSASSSVHSFDSRSTLTNSDINDSVMSRLLKSVEQKEEFLRRPSQPYMVKMPFQAISEQQQFMMDNLQQREFYARPNRLQNSIWPPHDASEMGNSLKPLLQHTSVSQPSSLTSTSSQDLQSAGNVNYNSRLSNQLALREQFFNSTSSPLPPTFALVKSASPTPYSSLPTSPHFLDQPSAAHHGVLGGSAGNIIEKSGNLGIDDCHNRLLSSSPISPNGLRFVSERTKLFESGRPLSPDGIDRTALYKSELSRLNTKQAVPNVALRRQVFELKSENASWRRSSDDKSRSNSTDSDSRRASLRTRSLSAESSKDNSRAQDKLNKMAEEKLRPPRPVRENSYLTAVRNSTAFWLQGPYPSDTSATATTAQVYQFKDNNMENSGQIILNNPRSIDHSNGNIKVVHRNQTIVELNNNNNNSNNNSNDNNNSNIFNNSNNNSSNISNDDVIMVTNYNYDHYNNPSPVVRPTTLNFLQSDTSSVILRPKLQREQHQRELREQQHQQHQTMSEDDERKMRRISYLKATANDMAFQIDSDLDNSPVSQAPETPDEQDPNAISQSKSAYRPWRRPRFTTDIQPLRRLFEESPPAVSLPPIIESMSSSRESSSDGTIAGVDATNNTPNTSNSATNNSINNKIYSIQPSHTAKSKALTYFRDPAADANTPVTKEGPVNVKVTLIDGKRSQDRTWRTCQAELKGNRLKLTILRDGKITNQSPEPCGGTIDLTNFHVTDGNYTKRKNVFRLSSANYPLTASSSAQNSSSTTPTSSSLCGFERELLIQAQSPQDMAQWIGNLKTVCRNSTQNSTEYLNNLGGQMAEPQRIAAIQSVQASSTTSGNDEFSPIMPNKTQRKYYLGSRSPSGQSPVTKSRKTPQNVNLTAPSASAAALFAKDNNSDKETGSPKQKSWKNFVTNQFKKIQSTSDSAAHDTVPEGASIGVPLAHCPPSDENPYVPLIVAKCTKIVETKGLSIVGIYRIPGNTAAITTLNELVNRTGLDEATLNDPKWDDVNVVSSLLKLFIRSLPEPLLPNELYSFFINADKLTDQVQRFSDIKILLKKLPTHNYETLKHLIKHLNRVSHNSLVNLMEPRNLAIVFGPSIVRKSNDTLEMVVKDMRHQCQIVESLVTNYLYFFENESVPKLKEKLHPSITETSQELPSADFLLENVAKIEQLLMIPAFNKESHRESSSRFVANIVQAANRKIRRSAQRRSTTSSVTPDTLSLDSTTSAESKDQTLSKHQRYLHENSKSLKVQSNESLIGAARSSEDDSNDSAFADNGSMSLTTVTALLDNKLRSLRNSSVDSDKDVMLGETSKFSAQTTVATQQQQRQFSNSYLSHLTHHNMSGRPLTMGENIPFADESPERPLIQARVKPIRHSCGANGNGVGNSAKKSDKIMEQSQKDKMNAMSTCTSSDDTDDSTTSNPREKITSAIRLDTEVLRKVNRILTNLEHLERKYSLNRSLSLNYKNHRNNECCCNNTTTTNVTNNAAIRSRSSLTKDEKTDKNNKRRQLYDSNSQEAKILTGSQPQQQGAGKYRRHMSGSRSIRRRHTVGGTVDFPSTKLGTGNCQNFINNHHYSTANNDNDDDLENKSDGN